MIHPRTFRMTTQHLALVSALAIRWDDMGLGAPYVSQRRPYGHHPTPEHVLALAGEHCDVRSWTGPEGQHVVEASERSQARAQQLHNEVGTALQIVLATRTWEPGTYRRQDNDGLAWERI